jgi:hypothetical protein
LSFFRPDEAPTVHIEQLPANTVAVDAIVKDYVSTRGGAVWPGMFITAWTRSSKSMSCIEGETEESFFENTCHDCEYHCEDYELDADGDYSIDHYDHGSLRVWGTIRVDSPCPCYNDGIGEVSFPCPAGHDGPGDADVSDRTLSLEHMAYGIQLSSLGNKLDDYCVQQQVGYLNDQVIVGHDERSINTFDGRNNICWGSNDEGVNLLEIESLYSSAPSNEDLLSFDGHDDGTDDLEEPDEGDEVPSAIWLGEYNHRPRALVCANATAMANAYILLATSGAKTNDTGIAYVPAMLYENVAIDDDTILNVWVSDEMPIGKRLMFFMYGSDKEFRSIFLGQIDNDFNLEPCTSQLPQSSAQAELVSS